MKLDPNWGRRRNAGIYRHRKLLPKDIAAIREHGTFSTAGRLAKKYGVCRSHILAIMRYDRWKGVIDGMD